MVWLRLFVCRWLACQRQIALCASCDRLNAYCGRECAAEARRVSLHKAGAEYQRSKRGRRHHAARQREYISDKRRERRRARRRERAARMARSAAGRFRRRRGTAALHPAAGQDGLRADASAPAGRETTVAEAPEPARADAFSATRQAPEATLSAHKSAAPQVEAGEKGLTHQGYPPSSPPGSRVDLTPTIAAVVVAPASGVKERADAHSDAGPVGASADREQSDATTCLRCARCERAGRLLPLRDDVPPRGRPP